MGTSVSAGFEANPLRPVPITRATPAGVRTVGSLDRLQGPITGPQSQVQNSCCLKVRSLIRNFPVPPRWVPEPHKTFFINSTDNGKMIYHHDNEGKRLQGF